VISEDVELSTRLEPGLGHVLIDKTQLEQVIMNLAVNARDAMPEGGSLAFETRSMTLDSAYRADHPNAVPGNYSILAITDSGSGIAPEVMAHIFEPFFTTKGMGKGTGLGLSTVYGIVQQAGGFVDVCSKVGSGTTVSVFLPQAESAARPLKLKQQVGKSLKGSETVLILEDNKELRQLTSKILGLNGYKVLEADAGPQAEAICRDYPEKIDLVLSDVVMPGLSGPEVVKRLVALRPNLRAIFMSGFTDDRPLAEKVLTDTTEFMQKPFGPTTLLAKIREVLDTAAADSKPISAA
jgi:CheY-like chemotaxis protein